MKTKLYALGLLISAVLIALSMTVLGSTQVLAPVLLVVGAYFFLGCLIKLCKANEKLKDTVLCALDILFWLP